MNVNGLSKEFIDQAMALPGLHQVYLHWHLQYLHDAHNFQIIPEHLLWWRVWLLLAGRGAGKTFTAANSIGFWAWQNPGWRIAVIAPTANDIRFTCFEGESGLLNKIPHQLIRKYNKSTFELELVNGSHIRGVSADSYERLRGPQYHAAWADELAAFEYGQECWDMLQFCLRLGENPRVIVSTTPKPSILLSKLMAAQGQTTYVARASSYANLPNLAPTFRERIRQYEGTTLGRQEIHAEIIDASEGGVIKKAWIQPWDADTAIPQLSFVLYSLDTAFTQASYDLKKGRDYTCATIWGVYLNTKLQCPAVLLLDCWFAQLGLPQLVKKIIAEKNKLFGQNIYEEVAKPKFGTNYAPIKFGGRAIDVILIEEAGSGISLRQMLKAHGIDSTGFNPHHASKIERLHACSPAFASGLVYMPARDGAFITETTELITQITTFQGEKSIPFDDGVDSTSQALNYLLFTNKIGVHTIWAQQERDSRETPVFVDRGNWYDC